VSDLDDTVGDAYDYGVYFLRDVGYFRRQERFWTSQDFPGAPLIRDRIEGKIESIGLKDPNLRDAEKMLQETQ
jgi:hypothetical protein